MDRTYLPILSHAKYSLGIYMHALGIGLGVVIKVGYSDKNGNEEAEKVLKDRISLKKGLFMTVSLM
ncbi:hypothetical protein [Alteribacter aurantiacus]|uniref:hypothetical protein n=1 Tax=Alteribacter aurantiacus TaxID=254410 RepID=UPI00047DBE67|nr:hypothetical protein [Alteribacter aurantiacus]